MTTIAIPNNLTVAARASLLNLKRKHLLQLGQKIRTRLVSHNTVNTSGPLTDSVLDGGYQAYVALWYQAMAAQQQSGQAQGDPSKPPGAA